MEAEQVLTAPVLTLTQKNGTTSPTFSLIQLDYENLHLAIDDTLVGTSGAHTGWKAPTGLVELHDKCETDLVSGQTMHMLNITLMLDLSGKLTLTEVSELECQLTANVPKDGDVPCEVLDTQESPGE